MLQLRANVGFKSLQDLDINLSIDALHAAPIAGHAYVSKPEGVRAWLDQQHSNAQVVSSHHVGDIPQNVKFELFQISHRDSNLQLRVSIFEYVLHCRPSLQQLHASSFQFGKGSLDDVRNATISSRTFARRSSKQGTSPSSAPQSLAYPSGGLPAAQFQITSSFIPSMVASHG